jgi:hypothetical protein
MNITPTATIRRVTARLPLLPGQRGRGPADPAQGPCVGPDLARTANPAMNPLANVDGP